MFLKVKHVSGKKYFALCESIRRDNKIVTKTIKSLGNEKKAFNLLESEHPEFLDRYREIVGTKKCRDKKYGLYSKDENDFLRVYYSGVSCGLLFDYESFDAAEQERKKYVSPERFIVKEIPNNLILQDQLELEKRLEDYL